MHSFEVRNLTPTGSLTSKFDLKVCFRPDNRPESSFWLVVYQMTVMLLLQMWIISILKKYFWFSNKINLISERRPEVELDLIHSHLVTWFLTDGFSWINIRIRISWLFMIINNTFTPHSHRRKWLISYESYLKGF